MISTDIGHLVLGADVVGLTGRDTDNLVNVHTAIAAVSRRTLVPDVVESRWIPPELEIALTVRALAKTPDPERRGGLVVGCTGQHAVCPVRVSDG